MDYIVSSGQVSNGLVISEGDSLEVTGGVVNDTVMNEGDAYIYDGGKANATIVNGHFDEDREDWYYGRLRVSAGGVANDTKLNGGDLYVYEDGTANDTAVNAGGYFGVYDGGETNRAVVNAKGAFYVEDGGVANDTVVSGYYDEEYGDWERGGVYVEGGGTANTISVNAGGELYVEYGGSAGDVIISAGGILDGFGWSEDRHFDSIEDGIVQVADGVSIEDRYMTVSSGGVANDTTVYGTEGRMHVDPATGCITVTKKGGGAERILAPQGEATDVIDTFVSAVLEGTPCDLDADAVFPSMQAMMAAIECSKTGKEIIL